MGKIILTIGEDDHLTESYSYQFNKPYGAEKNAATCIAASLMLEKKKDTDSVMMDGPFDCALTVYSGEGSMTRHLAFGGTEIVVFDGMWRS